MLQNSCRFLKFDQIFEMKTWKEITRAIVLVKILKTHKKMQSVIETIALPRLTKLLLKSIKIYDIYNTRMQFKSNAFHLPLSAVTLHQQQQTKTSCTSCLLKLNQLIRKRRNKIHLNSRKPTFALQMN